MNNQNKPQTTNTQTKQTHIVLEDCYDFDPEHPWKFQHALQKVFLSPTVKQLRWDMAKYLLRHGPDAAWWTHQVVWFDPCCSIVPGSQSQYDKMRRGGTFRTTRRCTCRTCRAQPLL
jgi:hypothetical protein